MGNHHNLSEPDKLNFYRAGMLGNSDVLASSRQSVGWGEEQSAANVPHYAEGTAI